MHLVMIEANGNQAFIFDSPRLRENVGASYLLKQLDTWVEDEARAMGVAGCDTDEGPCWVSRSSGKVILRVKDEGEARCLISRVTRTVIAQAPGMDVTGVFIDMGPGEGGSAVTQNHLVEIHRAAADFALTRPPAVARFPQMPFLTPSRDSPLPSSPCLGAPDESELDTNEALSLPSRVKRHLAHASRDDLKTTAEDKSYHLWRQGNLTSSLEDYERMLKAEPTSNADDTPEDSLSKVGIVHIDGNGIGAIMSGLDDAMTRVTGLKEIIGCDQDNPDALRRFLREINRRLDGATEAAFHEAWEQVTLWQEEHRPKNKKDPALVIPVLLGGDDVTVITAGNYAIPFTVWFLEAFERRTAEDRLLCHLGPNPSQALNPVKMQRMTAGAGVAIIPKNFPFHIGYELAEQLCTQAKKVGKRDGEECSTFSFHVLFDATVLDSQDLIDQTSALSTRPYRVGVQQDTQEEHPLWAQMCRKTAVFTAEASPDGRQLSLGEHIPFPKTRAARIRKYLSDAENADERSHDYRGMAEVEWQAALNGTDQDLRQQAEFIGSKQFLFDIIELAEVLPTGYAAAHADPPTIPSLLDGNPEEH